MIQWVEGVKRATIECELMGRQNDVKSKATRPLTR